MLQHLPLNGLIQSYRGVTLTSVRALVYVHFTLTLVLKTNKSALQSHLFGCSTTNRPPIPTPGHPPQLIKERQPVIGCGAVATEERMVGRRLQESITRADSTLERKVQQTPSSGPV